MHLLVGDGVDPGQVGDLHIDIGGFLGGFDKAEGFVQVFPSAVNAVLTPDYQAGRQHLFGGSDSDFVGAAEHPGQHIDAFREDNDALGMPPEPCFNVNPCKDCIINHSYPELFGKMVWDKTIKHADLPRYGWDANPWVWVFEFERTEKPEGWPNV